jgi:gas vesicle protein
VSKGDGQAKSRKKGGFIIGAAIGVIAGLLLAPRPGKETREKWLGGGLGAQADRLKTALGAGKESAGDQSDALRRKIEETRARLREQMGRQ